MLFLAHCKTQTPEKTDPSQFLSSLEKVSHQHHCFTSWILISPRDIIELVELLNTIHHLQTASLRETRPHTASPTWQITSVHHEKNEPNRVRMNINISFEYQQYFFFENFWCLTTETSLAGWCRQITRTMKSKRFSVLTFARYKPNQQDMTHTKKPKSISHEHRNALKKRIWKSNK